MPSPTIGFSVAAADQVRIQRLADAFTRGNRSEWLREATDLYEQWAVFRTLARVQARGDHAAADRGIDRDGLHELVDEAAERAAHGTETPVLSELLSTTSLLDVGETAESAPSNLEEFLEATEDPARASGAAAEE